MNDFQSLVRQPLLHHFGFGSLLRVAVYLCSNLLTINTSESPQAQSINPHTRVKRYHTQDFTERLSMLQYDWI